MKQEYIELLAPAGSWEALEAAVNAGADAVYMGGKAFGARAYASNFDKEEMAKAVYFAHMHRVRLYITVNTLVDDSELEELADYLLFLNNVGVDGIIVQDLGVIRLARQIVPELPLHASTQMTITNSSGVDFAVAAGMERSVLARELSLKEIEAACSRGTEIETFIHGALCVCYSGQCLMSSLIGGRSGNRGRCAQPCRQQLRMGDQEGPLLSLRDLCLLDDLPALCEAGISSIKIEGRLKSPEYVAVVASVYRHALDEIAKGTFHPGDLREKEKLLQIYNRGGFTRGHAMEAEDAAMVTPDRVSHEGLPLGEVIAVKRDLATLRVDRDLNDGDSLQLRGMAEADVRYSGHDVPAGGMATLRLRPGLSVVPGTPVARLSDARQLEAARKHQPAPIPISMVARFALGQPMGLTLFDGETSVRATGPVVEAAQKRASTAEDAKRQLEKLGGTPYVLAGENEPCIQVILDENVFLPVSALNALRRDAVELLTQARIEAFLSPAKTRVEPAAFPRPACNVISSDTLAVIFSDASLADALLDAGATMLVYAPRTFTADALKQQLASLPKGTWLRLPPQMTQATLDAAVPVIESHASRLGGLVAESVGHLDLPISLPMLAGEGVPVVNREGMETVRAKQVCGFSLWPEWTFAEQKGLLPHSLPCLMKLYGREMLMLLNHCPERVRLGLSMNRAGCRLCKSESMVCGKAQASMTDRKDYQFPLARTRFAEGCEIQVLGALPTDLRAYDADRRALGAGALLYFTIETAEEQLALTRQFAALLSGEQIAPSAVPTTAGHWLRGVE